MIHLEKLDASVARLDLALVRTQGLFDPLAVHELALSLDEFASQPLPSGWGGDLDFQLQQAIGLARRRLLGIAAVPPTAGMVAVESETTGVLRSKLLDIAAVISVLKSD